MSKHIELRGTNLLRAVVEGTEANAHLVATNGLAWGVYHAVEQYQISREKVLAAIRFYLNNQDEIDQLSREAFDDSRILRGEARQQEMKRRKEEYLQQQTTQE